MSKIFYYREGSTICHDFALNPERLAEILEIFQETNIELFSMLVMPNSNGSTPVDIALDNQSPRCLELMLAKLATLSSVKCAHLVLDRLEELLAMDLRSFQSFLGSCVFQTPQMKQITTLNLKEETEMFFDSHSSCMIDKAFTAKYCKEEEKHEEQDSEKVRATSQSAAFNTAINANPDDDLAQPLLQKAPAGRGISGALQRAVQRSVLEHDEEEEIRRTLKRQPRITPGEGSTERRVEVKAIEIDSIFVGKES